MNHKELVNFIGESLQKKGFSFDVEIPLPNGRGATDISCKVSNNYLFHAEVKESPSTIKSKNTLKQLKKYEAHFGFGPDYVLISPGNNEIFVQKLNGDKFKLDEYISRLNH